MVLSGVGDPFLQQIIRYHCPIYVMLKFSKPKNTSFERHTWYYDKGDYNALRNKARQTDWDSLHDNDINTYANNIGNQIVDLAAECIPNTTVRIKQSEPPWITTYIKRYIRKRKRTYKKAKRTNSHQDWQKFKILRNKTTQIIRDAKQTFYDNKAAKITSNSISSKGWWSILKSFIKPKNKASIPPIEDNDQFTPTSTIKQLFLTVSFRVSLF